MDQELARYFAAEKFESVFFIAAGVVAIAVSLWLWRTGDPFRGMGFPLVAIGLIQLGVGGGVFLRTDRQVAALRAQLASSPAEFKAAELPRMETVQRNFAIYKWAEIALLFIGVAMIVLLRRRELLYGVGLGLLIQAGLMLTLDVFAEHRGARYLEQVRAQ